MLDYQFSIHASECPVFIMNRLKSVYNIPFLDSYSHPIHTCLSMIASNDISPIGPRTLEDDEHSYYLSLHKHHFKTTLPFLVARLLSRAQLI